MSEPRRFVVQIIFLCVLEFAMLALVLASMLVEFPL